MCLLVLMSFELVLVVCSFLTNVSIGEASHPRAVLAPCLPGHFPCNSSEKCVEQRMNCDGRKDCPDGSDEWHCEDKSRKEFYDSLFRKRPDEDREKKMTYCALNTTLEVCRCSQRSLFCNHKGLNNIPDGLPQTVHELDLSGNSLHILKSSDFPYLPELETLILTSSHVKLLNVGVFSRFPSLKRLYLTSNSISVISNGTLASNQELKLLVVSHNPLNYLAPGAFLGLNNLRDLDLRDCNLRTLSSDLFTSLHKLKVLWLDGNHLDILPQYLFQSLSHLEILSLSRNDIESVNALNFIGLQSLKSLAASQNKLFRLESNSFGNLSTLLKLDLHGNEIRTIDKSAFGGLSKLESLNLKKNPLKKLQSDVFDELRTLKHIRKFTAGNLTMPSRLLQDIHRDLTSICQSYFDEFHMCSLALHVRVCEPRGDGISSIAHLLDSVVLRVSVWLVAVVACLGNVAVLIGRVFLTEPNEVHSFYIKNLSLADLLMSVYLFTIAAHDVVYRGEYILHETKWRHSWQCNLCGFLSTLSSESSVLILTIITTDRYASILYPLSVKRRTVCSAAVAMILVWSISILLSALPVLNISYYGDEFYGNNGVCLPLHIHDPFGQAWEYSTFLFCGVNLAAFLFIFFAYISMFFTISNSRIGLRSTQQLQDRTIAKRFAFIVGTDFLCWIPIVIIKVIAMGGVEIQEDLYAWVAVFLLPVNSALNPVLYTLTTKLFKQHLAKIVYSCRTTSTNSNDNSGISLTSILHHRNSKKTAVTTFSENGRSFPNKTTLLAPLSPQNDRPPSRRKKKKHLSCATEDML